MHSNPLQHPFLETTKDGSHTLYSPQFNQHYHSTNGAVSESRHVFFEQNGLKQALSERSRINILEIGFGSGLNLLLLMDYCLHLKTAPQIQYHSIEAYPISAQTAAALNYDAYLDHPELAQKLHPVFSQLTDGMNTFPVSGNINLSLFYGLFDDYEPTETTFDFIFHDAFSPQANPSLWSASVFEKLLAHSNPAAVLTTYCAASKARGAMARAGWNVARAPGALGKREMTAASPSEQPLAHLKRLNEKRLAQRYEGRDF
jgi:tRNA U34 5-methylaminomethyl-2-thiouridine-forming methyltransferase MnmC